MRRTSVEDVVGMTYLCIHSGPIHVGRVEDILKMSEISSMHSFTYEQ